MWARDARSLQAEAPTIALWYMYEDLARIVAIAQYVEVESGKRADRPELQQALDHAKQARATLLIAKLDRLSRNVAFIYRLLESGVELLCCDMPQANRLTLHILAAVAEHERQMISERTKAALAAAKEASGSLG